MKYPQVLERLEVHWPSDAQPIWKSAIQQVWKPALRGRCQDAPGDRRQKLSAIRESTRVVLPAEISAFFGFSWHDPANPPIFQNARSVVSFTDGHTTYVRIYWDGYLGKTDSPMFYDPPAGYDYKWSSD